MSAPREDVEYFSDGELVKGWFYPATQHGSNEPSSSNGLSGGVVFCPGFTGTKYAAFYQPYVERLVAAGHSVLLVDYRGWGDSAGPRDEIVPLRQVADVRNGLDYLQTRREVDPARLSVFGVSFGGGNAIYATALDQRVRCCIAVSPVGDGRRWMRSMRREYEWYELLQEIAADRVERMQGWPAQVTDPTEGILVSTPERRKTTVKGSVPGDLLPKSTPVWCAEKVIEFAPIDVVARIAPRALLLFYVARDAVVPGEQSEAMFAAADEPKALVRLPGEGHYSAYVEHFDAISARAVQWLEEYAK